MFAEGEGKKPGAGKEGAEGAEGAEALALGKGGGKKGLVVGKTGNVGLSNDMKSGGGTGQKQETAGKHTPGIPHKEGGPNARPERDFMKVYAPQSIKAGVRNVKDATGKGQGTGVEFTGAPGEAETKMPLTEVLPAARQQAEEAVSRQLIPADYRRLVREYFDKLNR